MTSLDWWDYHGETLCPRCGVGESGNRYKVCAEYDVPQGYQIQWRENGETLYLDDMRPHEMACERYTYGELCRECEESMTTESPDSE